MRSGVGTLAAGGAAGVVGLTAQSCGLTTIGLLLLLALGAVLITRQGDVRS
jgi:hypothetical protein